MSEAVSLQFTTIAELVFNSAPTFNFGSLVRDLDGLLSRFKTTEFTREWLDDEAVTFEMPGTRITLACHEAPRPELAAILCVSVGPSDIAPQPTRHLSSTKHSALCSRLAEKLMMRLQADAIFWHETPQAVRQDFLERLCETSPLSPQEFRSRAALQDVQRLSELLSRGFEQRRQLDSTCARPPQPKLTGRDPELARLRAALYPTPEPSSSMQIIGGRPVLTWQATHAQ